MQEMIYSKADTHIHTTYSDGFNTPEETVEIIAARTDLRVIAITDHDTAEGAFVAQAHAQHCGLPLEVVIGQEVSTREGDVVGLFLTATLPPYPTAAEAIEAIHAQGGLAVAVHPFSRWITFSLMPGLGRKILSLPLDGVEVRNGFPVNLVCNPLTGWINRNRGQGLPELGGSDSHIAFTAGQAFTWFPGRTAADLHRGIVENTIRAGGSLWTPPHLARLMWTVLRKGIPRYEQIYSD